MKNRIILGGSPVILDIGTYDGTDSIEFLDLYNNARIFAFESQDFSFCIKPKYFPYGSFRILATT